MTNFIQRPKLTIMGFLKGFFMQDKLFTHVPNEFKYIDNEQQDSLLIYASENHEDEKVNALPAVIYQEGGFTEDKRFMDNRNYFVPLSNFASHVAPISHPVILHCVAANKGSAELLQAAVAKAIITFRDAIYELGGIDNISVVQGSPPQRLTQANNVVATLYDATVQFNVRTQIEWNIDKIGGDWEETISLAIYAALTDLTFDENGNPTEPVTDWFVQNVSLDL